MRTLHLHVKKKWYNQIFNFEKTEDYRLITPYWSKRLVGREYDRIMVYCGYPEKKYITDKILYFKWNSYKVKTIRHEEFGNKTVKVFAIILGMEQ